MVAILTLEVTGIPSLSGDEIFPWPRPSFVERQTRGQVFEVRYIGVKAQVASRTF